MNRQLESDEVVAETPFTDWDIMCDNLNGGGTLDCEEQYSKTTGFTETWTTEHGFYIQVTVGTEVQAGGLFANLKRQRKRSASQQLLILELAKVEVRFYKSEIPVSVKWRETVFADGYIFLSFGNVLEKSTCLRYSLTLNVSGLL